MHNTSNRLCHLCVRAHTPACADIGPTEPHRSVIVKVVVYIENILHGGLTLANNFVEYISKGY